MNKKKIIGAGILLIITILFLSLSFINDKPKDLSKEEIENMFVEDDKPKEENLNKKEETNKESNNENNKPVNAEIKEKIVVEIRGEVINPNVYYMEKDNIVNDLIIKAGGLTNEADISNINRAKKLDNHELVVINNKNNPQPINPEIAKGDNSKSSLENSNDKSKGDKVNINTASKEQLMTLPSIGEKTAEKIINYREENGGFKSIDDLKNVERIGDKTLEKLKDKITV